VCAVFCRIARLLSLSLLEQELSMRAINFVSLYVRFNVREVVT
jgi:hypothetical protein